MADSRRLTPTEAARLIAHRGLATWGERTVPLSDFHAAVARCGRALGESERQRERAAYLARERGGRNSAVRVEGPYSRVVAFGGVYNNRFALEALLDEARSWGAEALYCLGDLGGFGPEPEKVCPLLDQGGVAVLQGNYEEALASGREDCNCGYTDPRDNHFAELSFRYTQSRCSDEFKAWMGTLPRQRRLLLGERQVLLVHGSPRRINEFLFESTSPDPFLAVLLQQHGCDAFLCTHTGLHWHRRLPSGGDVVNVGVIGRPANDGRAEVWYCRLEARPDGEISVEHRPLCYDHRALARAMRAEELPQEFIETIESGWWTTCLEVLPARERARSRY